MIRVKLFFGLISAVALLALAGAFGISLVRAEITALEQSIATEQRGLDLASVIGEEIEKLNRSLIDADPEKPAKEKETEASLERISAAVEELISIFPEQEQDPTDGIAMQDSFSAYEKLYLPERVRLASVDDYRSFLSVSDAATASYAPILERLNKNVIAQSNGLWTSEMKTRTFLITATVISLLIAFAVFWSLSRHILSPVKRLTESFHEIQRSNLDLQLPITSQDELGQLSDAFNVMTSGLRVQNLKNAEQVTRANAENKAIIEKFPHPILIVDELGAPLKWNPEASTLFRGEGGELTLPGRVRKLVDDSIASGEEYKPDELVKSLLIRVDERERFYLPSIFKIDDGSEFKGWGLVMTDVTNLRWIDDVKNDFLSTVSHEVRTPLTTIRMVLHLLAENKVGELNERQLEMVISGRSEGDRLIETINRLLATARSDSADELLAKRSTSPEEIITNGVKAFAIRSEGVDLDIRTICPENLPRVTADSVRINIVIQQLLSNALRHSPVGASLEVSAGEISSDLIRFSVFDEGSGVPDALGDSVFEKFVQAPGEEGEGIGLGLSISREIIHAHGGRIGTNREDRRTEFYFDLPRA